MTDGKTLRQAVREEIEKLKKMNFYEKRQYIWEYYKTQLLIIGLIIVVAFMITNRILNPPKENYLYIAWMGHLIDPTLLTELGERLEIIVDDPERQQVTVMSYAATNDPMVNNAMQTRLAAMVRLGDVDVILTMGSGVRELTEFEWLRPVDEVIEAMHGFTPPVYIIGGRNMAISLAGSRLLEEIGINPDDLYLTVLANAHRFDHIAKALQELLR
jgi:hypothetical protein